MKIVTWNVNSIVARQPFVLDFLETVRPDVVLLQELKVTDAAFGALPFLERGYATLTHGQPQWNGVGIMVRQGFDPSPRVLEVGLAGQEALGARFIEADVGGLRVASVYVPNGKTTAHPDFQSKLRFLEALAERERGKAGPSIIGGDWNLVPTDEDTWDPGQHEGRIFHTDLERDRFRAIAESKIDLFRVAHPVGQAFTWWDYRAGCFHKNQGLRIDLLLGSPELRGRVTEAQVWREFRKKRSDCTPSDHAPVMVTLSEP